MLINWKGELYVDKKKKDRNEYMKEYMRKYRKEKPEKNIEAVIRYWKKRIDKDFTEAKKDETSKQKHAQPDQE
jgi:hypothetical protein